MESTMTLEQPKPAAVSSMPWLGRIVCGDALNLLSEMPDKSVDVIITDPPYGGDTREWDKEPDARIWTEMQRVSRGVVAVCGYGKNHLKWARHFDGMKCLAYIVWHHENQPLVSPGLTRWHQDWVIWGQSQSQIDATAAREPYSENAIWHPDPFVETEKMGKPKKPNVPHPDGRRCGDVWRVQVESAGLRGFGRMHPNAKPMDVMRRLVLILTKPGDVVLDPYCGSGSTLVAAKELNRGWIGNDMMPEYCETARTRLSQDVLQLEACHAP